MTENTNSITSIQKDEQDADDFAVKLMINGGYNPLGGIRFLRNLGSGYQIYKRFLGFVIHDENTNHGTIESRVQRIKYVMDAVKYKVQYMPIKLSDDLLVFKKEYQQLIKQL